MVSPLFSFSALLFCLIGRYNYFLDPSTGRYFVEVPPEDDDDEDFAQ